MRALHFAFRLQQFFTLLLEWNIVLSPICILSYSLHFHSFRCERALRKTYPEDIKPAQTVDISFILLDNCDKYVSAGRTSITTRTVVRSEQIRCEQNVATHRARERESAVKPMCRMHCAPIILHDCTHLNHCKWRKFGE